MKQVLPAEFIRDNAYSGQAVGTRMNVKVPQLLRTNKTLLVSYSPLWWLGFGQLDINYGQMGKGNLS